MAREMKYKPKFGYDIRIKPPREEKAREAAKRVCEWPGCGRPATHKAPKSREQLREYRWFCVDHVREYNKAWNFFEGMDDLDVAAFQESARTGHRPTWNMGNHPANGAESDAAKIRRFYEVNDLTGDPFDFLKGENGAATARAPRMRRLTKLEEEAFAVFRLEPTASSDEVKTRYKELVKKFHPDANQGETGYEERLKRVIEAYQHLKAGGFC